MQNSEDKEKIIKDENQISLEDVPWEIQSIPTYRPEREKEIREKSKYNKRIREV